MQQLSTDQPIQEPSSLGEIGAVRNQLRDELLLLVNVFGAEGDVCF
jgi:hypothetical protein